MEVRQAELCETVITEMEDGSLWASVKVLRHPGGETPTLSIGPCSDASSLFQELLTAVDLWCFTFLATTIDGSIRPLHERVC